MNLTERIRKKIAQDGPVPLADYMALALGDPDYGYYMHKDPLGLKGDFVTSPEISQIFGELIGIWCAECWQQMGRPQIDVIELGPGRGTLMMDCLRATAHISGFHDAIRVHMVEMSPVLRKLQQQGLNGKHPRISWHDTLPETDRPKLIIANEFFDALPIRQFVVTEKGYCERMVDWRDNSFCFVAGENRNKLPGDYPPEPKGALPKGTIIEQCPLAQRVMMDIAQTLKTHGGAMLAIDYGYARAPHMLTAGDTVQAVYEHAYHNVLEHPGKADITAHVDFTTLADIARSMGVEAAPLMNQRDFLLKMGGKMRMEQLCRHANSKEQQERITQSFGRLVSREEMGTLFKVLAVTSGIKAPVLGV
ncbi:MAG: class I SAM-dependent methyltransferase [Rickettsiales bacterium]